MKPANVVPNGLISGKKSNANSLAENQKLVKEINLTSMTKAPIPGPEVMKIFMLNSAEHEIYPAYKF